MVERLYTRQAHKFVGYGPVLALLFTYFPLATWTAGSAVASGLVVPMLIIGGCLGRFVGLVMSDMFGEPKPGDYLEWIDPGAMALLGSAAFFGGVSRLTMSLTVIFVEITNDVTFLLPIMFA